MRKARVLKVCETFVSLQGEGIHSGLPFFFIRLSGCNLRCSYCDSKYAWHGGETLEVEQLVSMWLDSGLRHVLVTGGEPLMQEAVYPLMEKLLQKGAVCVLETNGSLPLKRVDRRVIKVVDWKTPGSGSADTFLLENMRFVTSKDQIKFVITSKEDYIWTSRLVRQKGLSSVVSVLLSPCFGKVEPVDLASWILEDRLEVRLQLQLHKVIWGEKKGL